MLYAARLDGHHVLNQCNRNWISVVFIFRTFCQYYFES